MSLPGKSAAAQRALGFVEPGMRLGLGTGSTSELFVRALGDRVRNGLEIAAVATSERIAGLARGVGIEVGNLDRFGSLDLVVDGADEFDPALDLIKGGGGALLREKIVASASAKVVIIADAGKRVARLGAYPLPVEVIRFGRETTRARIELSLMDLGYRSPRITLRRRGDEPLLTDEMHNILDLHLREIPDSHVLATALNGIPGVVEHGLFLDVADVCIVGDDDGHIVLETATQGAADGV